MCKLFISNHQIKYTKNCVYKCGIIYKYADEYLTIKLTHVCRVKFIFITKLNHV